jgi:hypothetical protein
VKAPAQLEILPETEEMLRPRPLIIRDRLQRPASKDCQRPAGRENTCWPLQLGRQRFTIASILDLQRPSFQDLAGSIHRLPIGPHEQWSDRREAFILCQRRDRRLETVSLNRDIGIEERQVLEVRIELAESPIAASSKTAIDLLFHQHEPPIVEAPDELAGIVTRDIVDDHHPIEPGRPQERFETGREIVGGIVAYHHRADTHHNSPGFVENDGILSIN